MENLLSILRKAAKIPKTLSIAFVFLILSVTSLFAESNAYAQTKKFDINLENKTVKEVFRYIEKNSEFIFVYYDYAVDTKRKVNLRITNKSIQEVLNQLFKGTDVVYKIDNRQIILKKQETETKQKVSELIKKEIEISGIVKDETGEAVIGANITVKGAHIGTVSDINGNYKIKVPNSNSILVFSYIGFSNQEITVGNRTVINVTLIPSVEQLNELVVTALGIKREKKALGYAVQELKGNEIKETPEPNIMSSLTGKIAGLTVFNKLGTFEAPSFNLRGSSNVLFVVDGVPGADTWSLNPDDIEKIDVIKGATGAALYGAQGTDGVIMITTKKGGNNPQGLSIEFNSSNTFQAGYLVLPEYQTRYGQGMNGQYSYVNGNGDGINDATTSMWGPELNQKDPTTASGYVELPQFNSPRDPATGKLIPLPWITRTKNPIKEFLNMGLTTNNSLSIGGNNEFGDFRVSVSQLYRKGQTPGTDIQNNNIDISGGYKFFNKLRIDAKVSYNQLASDNYETANYDWQNYILNIGYYMGPNVDMNALKNYWKPGREGYEQLTWVQSRNNPYWLLNERTQEYRRDRLTGWLKGEYEFTSYLKLMARAAMIYSNTNSAFKENKGNRLYSDGKGTFTNSKVANYDINLDWLLMYNRRHFQDALGVEVAVGGNARTTNNSELWAGIYELVVPGLYNLSNRKGDYSATNERSEKKVNSFYGTATIDYKSMVYLGITGRNDWSSALPKENNSYFYPSVSLSGIITEMVKLPKFITFAKIRGSWAQGRQDISAYWNRPVYTVGNWNDNPTASYPSTLTASNLKAQKLNTYEIGGDIRFFDNRLGFDYTYYYKSVTDMITTLNISEASGYSTKQINGREINTKGFEVTINATPVRTLNFEWNTQVNLGAWKDYLGKLAPGETKYQGIYRESERLNRYRGRVFERSVDGDIIYTNGLPSREDEWQVLGYSDPDLTWGFINNFRFKNWRLTVAIDGRFGGLIYNYMHSTMMSTGAAKETAIGDIRNRPFVGNGVKVISGEVIRDERGNVVHDSREYIRNDVEVNYYDWVQGYYEGMHEVNLYDNTFLKLREISLTYNFPSKLLSRTKIKGASLSLTGRNLLLFSNVPFTDPDRGYDDQGQGPSTRNIGFNVNIKF